MRHKYPAPGYFSDADFQRDVPRAPYGAVRSRPRPISNRVCRGISPAFLFIGQKRVLYSTNTRNF